MAVAAAHGIATLGTLRDGTTLGWQLIRGAAVANPKVSDNNAFCTRMHPSAGGACKPFFCCSTHLHACGATQPPLRQHHRVTCFPKNPAENLQHNVPAFHPPDRTARPHSHTSCTSPSVQFQRPVGELKTRTNITCCSPAHRTAAAMRPNTLLRSARSCEPPCPPRCACCTAALSPSWTRARVSRHNKHDPCPRFINLGSLEANGPALCASAEPVSDV